MKHASSTVLADPAFRVPSATYAPHGVAWLRATVARFSSGTTHHRRRGITTNLLTAVDPATLRERARVLAADRPFRTVAVEALAEALHVRVSTEDVSAVALVYHPHLNAGAEEDQAVARLVDCCGGEWNEHTAAKIGVLVQACAATSNLVANALKCAGDAGTAIATALRDDPPVPTTRRIDPTGTAVEVPLAGVPFGAGAHACPGHEHAVAIACAIVEVLRRGTVRDDLI
ncbi:MAG: hypothetical protein JOZ47_17330 [Kutzneria sp.]|nr:hypothetical protein [Kutzneria sp.]MBV9846807.1 hypothetical protein [Kutzneria sp.]